MKRRAHWLALLILAAAHVWLAHSASREFGHTGDENAHLTGGYSYWKFADYRLHPENGNLAQRWVALPLLAQDLKFPSRERSEWHKGNYWLVSNAFLCESGNDLPRMLTAGRWMNALLGGALVLLVAGWTHSLFGAGAGWAAAVLAAFSPTLLTHAGLANSDVTAALAFLVALLAWWRLLHRVTIGRIVIAGLTVGALALSKFSAVIFAPVALALLLVRAGRHARLPVQFLRRPARGPGWRLAALLPAGAVTTFVAVAVIWAGYGFRFSVTPDAVDPETWNWETVTRNFAGERTFVGRFVLNAREHRLLPAAWLFGLAYVQSTSEARPNFLAGQFSPHGWRSFFPFAFAVKTTIGLQALLLLAASLPWLSRQRRTTCWLYRISPLLVFTGAYAAFAIASHINIGHRHILPIYPALFILAAGAVPAAGTRRVLLTLVVSLLGWHVAASLLIRPHYIAYFNEWAGGPANGHRLLVDSSLDWGQSLPGLQSWLKSNHRDEAVYLAYFGTDRPSRLGLKVIRTGDSQFDSEPRSAPPALEPGLYCISATLLHQPYALWPGYWSLMRERMYFDQRDWLARLAVERATWAEDDPRAVEFDRHRRAFDHLRFGRLCFFLRTREPDAHIGYAMFVYRLSAEDLARYLDEPLLP